MTGCRGEEEKVENWCRDVVSGRERGRDGGRVRCGAMEGGGVRVTWSALLPLQRRGFIPPPATIKVLLPYPNMLLLN